MPPGDRGFAEDGLAVGAVWGERIVLPVKCEGKAPPRGRDLIHHIVPEPDIAQFQ